MTASTSTSSNRVNARGDLVGTAVLAEPHGGTGSPPRPSGPLRLVCRVGGTGVPPVRTRPDLPDAGPTGQLTCNALPVHRPVQLPMTPDGSPALGPIDQMSGLPVRAWCWPGAAYM